MLMHQTQQIYDINDDTIEASSCFVLLISNISNNTIIIKKS